MYIDKYLVSKVIEKPYSDSIVDKDQMRYERKLRERIAQRNPEYPGFKDGDVWHYKYAYGNSFVDFSTFYSVLTYVSFSAVSFIESENECEVPSVLWSYGAATVWCNGEKAIEIDTPVYKPIMKNDFTLRLRKGRNEIFVLFQNLGVRDTRNLFAIEVDSDNLAVHSGRPDAENAQKWLDNTVLTGRRIVFPDMCRFKAILGRDSKSPDYAKVESRVSWIDITGLNEIELSEGAPYIIVEVDTGSDKLRRYFEIADFIHPEYTGYTDRDKNYRRMLGVIASADGLSRGDKFGFYIQNILARKALGIVNPHDEEYFYTTLDQIEARFDCSDFLISGVVRYMKNYPISEKLSARIKDVLQNYRYWMTMDGADAMCFWSENHSLLFYSSAMIVGAMYPEMYFPRAKMTGTELSAFGRRLSMEWFDDLDRYGFEEFLSTVYMNVTFACLLNIIDYGDSEISERARKVTDRMLRMLAMHTFSGSVIAPMGRVYRGIINPSKQGAQALMNLIDPAVPTSFGEGWLSYFATSSYKIPDDLAGLMHSPCTEDYSSGNAEIKLIKKADYCLTSVQSPRQDGVGRWENITLGDNPSAYENTHLYTKSFNERFHGTTFFQPGVYGYQQHMWTAALNEEAILFVNHPGSSSDHSSMRPGYWYGNGVMPALRQEDSLLGAVYRIPECHPIAFTHVYFPECHYDESMLSSHWIFARKGNGYIALYSSAAMVPYDDELSASELRVYSRDSGYVCFAGSLSENGSFEEFRKAVISRKPAYADGRLYVDGKLLIEYLQMDDKTQYV